MRRIFIPLLGLAVLAMAFVALRTRPLPVELGTVTRGPMRVTVDGDGMTRVLDRFVVSAPVSGRLERVGLRAGQRVTRGQLLATMVPSAPPFLDTRSRSELRLRAEAAAADVRRLEHARGSAAAALQLARLELSRLSQLARAKAATPSMLDAARLDLQSRGQALEAAGAAVQAARFQEEAARASLQDAGSPPGAAVTATIAVTSPVSGSVLKVLQESARVVPVGTPLLELADLQSLELVADLLSSQAVQVRTGAAAFVEHWGGAATLAAAVDRIEPGGFTKISALGVEEQRVNVVYRLSRQASGVTVPDFGDGYRVEIRTVVWEAPDVLKVPIGALFRHGKLWSVFVLDGSLVRRKAVEIGHRDDFDAQVLQGLGEGQSVVVHPSDKLDDGVTVERISQP